MSLLRSLFGSKSKTPPGGDGGGVDERDRALIRQDVGRLDQVRPGLGEQLVDFICGAGNDSVLLTLGQVKAEAVEILKASGWSSAGKWVSGRAHFLLAPHAWRPDVVRRYGQVLAPVHEGSQWPRLIGSDRSPLWFRALLQEYDVAHRMATNPRFEWKTPPREAARQPWPVSALTDLLEDDQAPILDAAFDRDDSRISNFYRPGGSPEDMPGFEAHLRADPARRVREIRGLSAKARGFALHTLTRLGLADGEWFDLAFEQAGDSSKAAREAACLLLRSASPELLMERTRAEWGAMKAARKVEIARVTMAACGDRAAPLLRGLIEAEKSDSVRADLERLLAQGAGGGEDASDRVDGEGGYVALGGQWIAAPPPAAPPPDTPVSPALSALFDQAFALWRAEVEQHNAKITGPKARGRQTPPPGDATRHVCDLLDGRPGPGAMLASQLFNGLVPSWGQQSKPRAAIRAQILAHPDLTLWHLLRGGRWTHAGQSLVAFAMGDLGAAVRARLETDGGLQLYSDMCAVLGDAEDDAMRFLLSDRHSLAGDLDEHAPEGLWPYLARHMALIDEALGTAPPSGAAKLSETQALDLISRFPATPARFRVALLDRAVGDRKLVRQTARDLLARDSGLDSLLAPLLKHPKAETRAGVAEWLADRGAVGTREDLLAAARKEASPAVKAALLGAISRLGGDIGEFVSSEALLGEAEAGLKKTPGKGLEWFPFEGMPAVHRADGAWLDPKVVRWWVVLAVRLKQPGASAWFELLLDELAPADAGKLGLAILSAWIAHDTERPSEAEANAHAAQKVDAALAQYQRWQPDMTREKLFASLRQQKLGEYFRSGNDSKGVLALAARAPGPEAVGCVRAFFRDHYPRTAQCKALLECLAANPSPVAIQYVLSIAKRWRTRTVQELAGELVNAIAERRGWTAEQLADRTIPTGGFDDLGVLDLTIGERAYAARLDAQNRIVLFNPEGKPVQGLPASVAAEDAESLKAAKAALSSARKEVKQVFEFQAKRLYEALCVGRAWPAGDWLEFLLRHPLMGRLVQRLVWVGLDAGGGALASFRPMDDLSLTDAADGAVDPAGFDRIRLAHRTGLSAADQAAWRDHLKDYAVVPVFDQFGRPELPVASLAAGAAEIDDRRGWLIETFKLRGAATRLGYVRGQAEDGGWFYTYQKTFDALGLAAVVEFTGNGLPEENRTCALVALRFARLRKGSHWNAGQPLAGVPPVLLNEAWNDFHDMAAAGTGFDPDWEKKTAW